MPFKMKSKLIAAGAGGAAILAASFILVTSSTASAETQSRESSVDLRQAEMHQIDPNTLVPAGSSANGEYFTGLSTNGKKCFVILPALDPGTVVSSCASDARFLANGVGLSVEYTDNPEASFGAYYVPEDETARVANDGLIAVSDSVVEGTYEAVSSPSPSDARSSSGFELLPLTGME